MKLLLKLYCFFLATLLTTSTVAANAFDLTGRVVDETNKPVEVGNVLLLSPQDSSLIKGDVFLEGAFTIASVTTQSFLLKITALGFDDYFQMVDNNAPDPLMDLGTIRLKTTLMEGVEVVAKQIVYEKRGDNLVINIANTSLQSTGTAMDVLRNSPKVLVNNGNQVSVIGKGTALIYVDGQLIASNQILENLSSNDLKEIEIMENPSAKYDAAGNAVINIITKGRTVEGYKIGLVQEIEKRTDFRGYAKVDGYYSLSKLMFQASYGIRPMNRAGREYYFRTYELNDQLVEIDNKLEYNRRILGHDYSFRTAYQISSTSKMGLQYSGLSSHGEKDALNRNVFNEDKVTSFRINTNIDGPYDQNSNIVNAFFEKSLDTLGSNILVTGQYSNYNLDRLENINQVLDEKGVTSTLNRRTRNFNNLDVSSFQIDYVKAFTKDVQLGLGAKNAYVTNKSILNFEAEQENGSFQLVPSASSDYDYDENILAAYTELNANKGKWKGNLGLRGEWTKTNGVSSQDESEPLFSRDYFNLFPSGSLTRTLTENSSVNISYNYRIQRPAFQDLNPFIFYVDSLVSLQGNSKLVPEYSHNLSGEFAVNNWTFGLDYTYVKNKINTIIRIKDASDPGVFAFIRDNIQRVQGLTASVTYPIQAKWYSSYNVVGARMEAHDFLDQGVIVTNAKAGYYLYTNQSFQLPGDVKLECIIQYTSPRVDGIYTDNPVSAVSIAASRKFFDNHLTVRVLGNDIFDKYKFTGISRFGGIDMDYLSEGDWHFVKLSLNWDFGKLGIGSLREKKISNEELQRIQQQ